MLWDWIGGIPVDVLERHYSTTPFQGAIGYGDIIRIADGTRFHLRSAHQILSALFPGNPEFLASLDDVLQRVEFGLPSSAVSLTQLPVPLTRGQYLALFYAGCTGTVEVAQLSKERLVECVGLPAASLLRPESMTGAA
jgi:hypothetical protein